MPIIIDLSHTSHTRARTGIQRVVKALYTQLGGKCVGVTYDPYEAAWRPLRAWEERNLEAAKPSRTRGSRWPLWARIGGRIRRGGRLGAGMVDEAQGAPAGVIVPEIFSPDVQRALPGLLVAAKGPRVAIFHDSLALQYPEFAPLSTRRRFPSYMKALLQFDGVAAVSRASRETLLDYWGWLGARKVPPVEAIPLGIDAPPPGGERRKPGATTILCVGSIEGRKNHAALLDACEALWRRGMKFELRLIGLANSETGRSALERISGMRSAGMPLRYDGPVDDPTLEAAYRDATFTVYPSLAEGFGMPVAESLVRGCPCLCRMDGALDEIASEGGCVGLGAASAAEIEAAIGGLLAAPYELARLVAAARARSFRGWDGYSNGLLTWMEGLRRDA